MDERIREAIYRRVAEEPFARKFGLRLLDLDEGYSLVTMSLTPEMGNIFGKAHGGAIFALIDEAFETASNSHGTTAVALNMSVTYVAAPAMGAVLTAEAREVNRTKRTAVYDIKVRENGERLIASCQALVYRLETPLPFLTPGPPAGGPDSTP